MGDDRSRILELLATGKITAEEAGRLLDALEPNPQASPETGSLGDFADKALAAPSAPKFLYVKVVSVKGDNVNVKIPLGLVRAGLKLTSFIPQPAMEQINKNMAAKGMSVDFLNFKPEDLEELVSALREMEVNVDANNGDTVRVYAE
jgi:hypothetical protein